MGVLAFFIFCISAYIIALTPLFRANFNYIDDNGRVAAGYRGWIDFSRFTSEHLSRYVHTNSVLSDISPLTQIIAIFLLVIAGLVIIRVVYSEFKTLSIWLACPILLLGLSPYFLECLSYKFDSTYMALSVLAGIAPFWFHRQKYLFFVASFIGALLVCTTYQVSTAAYMVMFVFFIAVRWNRGEPYKEILIDAIAGGLGFVAGLLYFRTFIMIPVNTYVSNEIANWQEVRSNFSKFFKLIKSDFRSSWLKLVYTLFACFIFTFVLNSKRNKGISFIVAVISVVLFAFCSHGLYALLKAPLYTPRGMYGVNICLAVCAVYVCTASGNIIPKIAVFCLTWVFFVFSCIYGNALSAQKQYTEFRTTLLINDLNHIASFDNPSVRKPLTVHGNIGMAPVTRTTMSRYPILKRLVPSTLGDSAWSWNVSALQGHYGLQNVYRDTTNGEGAEKLVDTMYHRISHTGDHYFVYLK